MNITNFCEGILLGETLDQKLVTPAVIDFSSQVYKGRLPTLPKREECLAFNTDKRVILPSLQQLSDERQRGILLHFFLNHELLALELMALMLLRFPEAPVSFKKGLVKTMKEEQKHARLYLKLMKDYGIAAGDVPVNKFFWDCLAGSRDLKYFVAGMSLTFEQANLDFSLYYKQAFEKIGDTLASEVLTTVYEEEITHVCHGLSWFRRWKGRGLSDWQAYARILEIPLSPSRGKGPLFDFAGRQKSGFDEEFIDNMKVTSMSRGRSPDVYLFHGFAEASIAEGHSFNFPRWGLSLEGDLSLLPLVFTRKDDLLLSWKDISTKHLNKLQKAGLPVPEIGRCFVEHPVASLGKRHAASLNPWGWSPFIDQKLQPLLQQNSKLSGWTEEFKNLFSKSFACRLSKKFKEQESHPWFSEFLPSTICKDYEQIEADINKLSNSFSCIVVKAPLGASGRNMLRIIEAETTASQQGQLKAMLKLHGEVIVEPWFDRCLDFSLHFDINEKVSFKGVTRLLNDERGQYAGTIMGSPWRDVADAHRRLLNSANKKGLNGFGQYLAECLSRELKDHSYKGPLGIDAFIYADAQGELQVRPIVEMNFRMTMGRVALEFEKYIASGRTGLMRIMSLKSKRHSSWRSRLKEISNEVPGKNEKDKWDRGCFLLNEYSEELLFPIVLAIGENEEDCHQLLTDGDSSLI